MPWNSGTTSIDPSIVSDYKKRDGWELVYNTFSPSTQLNDPSYTYYFALYNKYRGQLRFYLWQSASSVATSYVNNGLSLYGGQTSSMLNYNATDLVDPSMNQAGFSQVLNQQINASGGTWFVMQYEIAYDANVANSTFPLVGLTWVSNWIGVSTLKLNGTQTGTIKGTIGNPNQPEFNLNSYLTSFFQKGVITLLGGAAGSAYSGILGATTITALTNARDGLVKGFFSGIVGGVTGGNTSTAQPITLNMSTKIELSGTAVSNGGLENMKLILPGQTNSQTADGFTPAYNSVMGVFNISEKPIVRLTQTQYTTGPWEDPEYGIYTENQQEDSYTLDDNSYSLIWNPAIINSSATGASITNLKKEVMALKAPHPNYQGGFGGARTPMCSCGGRSAYPMIVDGYGVEEFIAPYNVAVSDSSIPLLIDYSLSYGFSPIIAVRFSFDVVPNDGSAPSKIVKTFLANVQSVQ
ncbi:MAG TPA: hypothetical protein VF598_03870 [Hymenobacter sp.]